MRYGRIDSWYRLGSFRVDNRELEALRIKETMGLQYCLGSDRRNCNGVVDGVVRRVQAHLFIWLLVSLTGCTNGWSVGENVETYAYVEILDQDSTSHFYSDQIRINADNWCFTHSRFEIIREQ